MWPTQSLHEIAQVKKILQEDDERFDHYLGLLENWMDCHAFLPKNYDKRMLPIFLRNCNYNLDKTKQKLVLYFVYKKRYPEAFCCYQFNDAKKRALDNFYLFETSKLTPEGYRVGIGGFRSPDTTGCDMNAVNEILAMFGTYKINQDVINRGIIIVVDSKHLSPSIVTAVLNPFFKQLLVMLQKAYPFRIGGIYLTSVPGFAVPLANMLKMMFKEKVRSRVYIESGNEEMKKNIPAYCLPKEFGGTDGTINDNSAKFIQEVMRARPWLLEQEKIQMVGDIPKDLYEISGINEDFGTQGSFRKLNID